MNLCNELATRAGATRVSLGWLKGKNIKIKALSHTEQFDKKQELVVELEKVMEEALDESEAFYRRIMGGEVLHGVEVVRQRKDGRMLDLALHTAPLPDGNASGFLVLAFALFTAAWYGRGSIENNGSPRRTSSPSL